MRLADLLTEYLLAWVLLAVAIGFAVPGVAVVTEASTPILAVMIGSISLTLSVERFRAIDPRTLALVLVGHLAMPLLAFAIARALALSPELVVGFVVLGAVTPELVTPVMTELAGGDTALSTTALVCIGLASVGIVPVALFLLASGVAVPTGPIVEGVLVAVVLPMALAVGTRARFPARVSRYDEYYPAISALMVILVIGGVTAANASIVRSNAPVVLVGVGALLLNALGYALGFLLGTRASRGERIAATLSVGMRDFAVAAALVVAAGLPTIASLPAVAFGVVEMTTSAGLATYFARRESEG